MLRHHQGLRELRVVLRGLRVGREVASEPRLAGCSKGPRLVETQSASGTYMVPTNPMGAEERES